MKRRLASATTVGLLIVSLAACGGGPDGLTRAEASFCVENVSPTQMSAVADEMGVDIAGAFDAAERAAGEALDDDLDGAAVLEAAQEAMEAHPAYIEVCRSMYENR